MILEPGVHVVQSSQWGEFKTQIKTPSVRVGDLQFTKHSIPATSYFVGYAPRVNFNLQKFSWTELKAVAKQEKCAMIRFDVPNVIKKEVRSLNLANIEDKSSHLPKNHSVRLEQVLDTLNEKCVVAPRSTFARYNVLLDITPSEEELMENLESKTRYNSRLAARRGVKVRLDNSAKALGDFYDLHVKTATRQGFLTHSKEYFIKAFNTLRNYDMANIMIAEYEGEVLTSWILFNHGRNFYYPYGGSSTTHRRNMPSNLLAWETIKLGKRLGCELYDMWGATADEKDPWWGFTKFKLGYGGVLVEYIDSYDFVVNPIVYRLFNLAYGVFWRLKGR